jgi:hypothetical protein
MIYLPRRICRLVARRDKDPETAPAIQWAGCRDARIAASSGLFALNREISVCAGLRGGVGSCLTFKPHKDLTKREGHLAALSGNQNFCSRPHLFGCRKEIFRTEPQRRLRRGAAGRNSGD